MEFIYEEDDIFDPVICESIIQRFEMDKRQQIGQTAGGVHVNIKKGIDLPISLPHAKSDWLDIIQLTTSKVNEALSKYTKYVTDKLNIKDSNIIDKFREGISYSTIGTPQIQKTEKDGFYIWHHDGLINRTFTYIIYLNDVPPEHGGTTDFICGKCVTPKAGKIVIFPAHPTYLHRGHMLSDGVKYIITNFIYEGPPIHTNPNISK